MKINIIKGYRQGNVSKDQIDITIKTQDEFYLYKDENIHTDITTQSVFKGLEELISEIYDDSSYLTTDQDIFPPGVLYVDKNYVIFERPPTYQNLHIIPKLLDEINYSKDVARVYRIPIPWQVYIVKIHTVEEKMYCADVKMFFTQRQITSFEDRVFLPVITNFYNDGSLCRPLYSDIEDIEKYPKNILGTIQAAYDWIWNSGSNADLTMSFVNFMMMHRNCETVQDVKNLNSIVSDFSNYTIQRMFAGRVKQFYSISSYFCSSLVIFEILNEWERIPLEKIIDYIWPNPCVAKNSNVFYTNCKDWLLDQFLEEQKIDLSEFLHYDEEDGEPYTCDEYECACRGYGTYIDENLWLEYQYNRAYPETTLGQAFSRSIISDKMNNEYYGQPYLENLYRVNRFANLRNKLSYSLPI